MDSKMKSKQETVQFLLSVLIDLKNNYDHNDTVLEKAIQHLKYQESVYHENKD